MTTREGLIEALRRHRAHNEHEERMQARVLSFVEQHEECFARSLPIGHVTGSAWVVDWERSHALLTHHAKLDKWLQMGGHCDGETDVLKVALREVEEESGLSGVLPLLGGAIFDVDAHEIPARGNESAHVHYDVRFAFEADRTMPLHISEESKDLAWVPLDRIRTLNTDESVMRLVEKTALLRRTA